MIVDDALLDEATRDCCDRSLGDLTSECFRELCVGPSLRMFAKASIHRELLSTDSHVFNWTMGEDDVADLVEALRSL